MKKKSVQFLCSALVALVVASISYKIIGIPNLFAPDFTSENSKIETLHKHSRSSGKTIIARDPKKALQIQTAESFTKAIADAMAIEDDFARNKVLKDIATEWSKTDLEACFAWANSLGNLKEKSFVLTRIVLDVLKGGDPIKAESLIDRIPPGEARDTMISYGMLMIASSDIKMAVRLMATISSEQSIKSSMRDMVGTIIAEGKVDALQQVMTDMPYGALRDSFNEAVLNNVSVNNPQLAFDWLQRNPDAVSLDTLNALGAGFASNNPLKGIEAAENFKNGQDRKLFLGSLFNEWTRKDPKSAGAWVTSQVKDSGFVDNKEDFEIVAEESVRIDQDLIFQQLAKISSSTERTSATLIAAKYLSKYNPQKAVGIALAEGLNQTPEQVKTLQITAQNWLNRDSLAASKWIGSLTEGPVRDATVSELIKNLIEKDQDYDAAMKWANTIQSKENRDKQIAVINNRVK